MQDHMMKKKVSYVYKVQDSFEKQFEQHLSG